MTLRPGGSYPMARRAHHRNRRAQNQQQATAQAARARAATASGGGFLISPSQPYTLYGQYITPANSPAGSAGSPRAQKAIKAQKASSGGL